MNPAPERFSPGPDAISFYYGLTGLACFFWYYLPPVWRCRYGRTLWLRCVLPPAYPLGGGTVA
ncbi:MAG TPA: hypothetical protein VGS97_17410 [Actinocrinis sp.]|uniref:hypothetical protein n=1 Tax=Actinocrinis sp. TaxID=1920516 RepID=UPI002DDCC003|nr:hypothetical protein [Actinocrinis sp.]HEV2345880.1 hypothetical protein [Actinocrinis sp.]